jgi:hypothetical protein
MRMYRSRGPRRRRPRSRASGCLLLVLLVIVVLIILSLMFGGFQKGTKSSGTDNARVNGTVLAV